MDSRLALIPGQNLFQASPSRIGKLIVALVFPFAVVEEYGFDAISRNLSVGLGGPMGNACQRYLPRSPTA